MCFRVSKSDFLAHMPSTSRLEEVLDAGTVLGYYYRRDLTGYTPQRYKELSAELTTDRRGTECFMMKNGTPK